MLLLLLLLSLLSYFLLSLYFSFCFKSNDVSAFPAPFFPSFSHTVSLSLSHTLFLPSTIPPTLHCAILSRLADKKVRELSFPYLSLTRNEKGTLTHSFRPTKDMQSGNCWFTILRKARNLHNHGILLSPNNRSFCFIIQTSKINPFERFLEM